MATATLALTYVSNSGSGVGGGGALAENDNTYFTVSWNSGESGDRWAQYNTNATSIIPAGSTLTYWRIKYRAYSPSWTTVGYPVPKAWFAQYTAGINIGDYDLTGTETQYTYPNPDFYPLGNSLSGVTLEELASVKFGGNCGSSSGVATIYFDELIIEVDYEAALSTVPPLLFMNENM